MKSVSQLTLAKAIRSFSQGATIKSWQYLFMNAMGNPLLENANANANANA